MRNVFRLLVIALLLWPVQIRAQDIDLLLVLGADVSRSMTPVELRMQRDGYIHALRDPQLLDLMMSTTPHGRMAIAIFEWSSANDQKTIIPCTIITPGAISEMANRLAAEPLRTGMWTSISGAMIFAEQIREACPYTAERYVLDISGDGINNQGGPTAEVRDRMVDNGWTINGLPVMRETNTEAEVTTLETHYRTQVQGGPGSFTLPVREFVNFGEMLLRKLRMEIVESVSVRYADGRD